MTHASSAPSSLTSIDASPTLSVPSALLFCLCGRSGGRGGQVGSGERGVGKGEDVIPAQGVPVTCTPKEKKPGQKIPNKQILVP
jgi:hypothetical protein